MDRRTEPRFSISSRVKVTLLSSLDRQIDGRMVDLSATGFAFLTERKLAGGDIVGLSTQLGMLWTRRACGLLSRSVGRGWSSGRRNRGRTGPCAGLMERLP